ncbi:MAG: serine/threonine protein kinase [Xanthomonadales bacterium]|nr:serine/threonine protein kinase [Xanthomonadales bacterium]
MPPPDPRARLLREALDLPTTARDAYLVKTCAADAALLTSLRHLLALDAATGLPLDRPAEIHAADLVAGDNGAGAGTRLRAGTRIGAYRLVRELGRGGMGSVWLAERADGQFSQQVALKLIRLGMDSEHIQRQFRRERALLARLQHPNIAQLIDGGLDDRGRPWFAMEYIEGVGLGEWIDRSAPTLDERLGLFAKLCNAVAHAHRQLVVHRDLKPSNVLVQENGEPRLLDFGIARLADPTDAERTATQQRFLTRDFAAPEQLRGEAAGTSADVYALGLILFELLTGCRYRSLHRDGDATLRPSAVTARPADAGTGRVITRARLRGDLDAIVVRALADEPSRRYADAQQLADDIERHLQGQPIRAVPDSFGYRAAKFMRRNRVAVSAALLVALSLLLGAVVSGSQAMRARHAQAVAEDQARRAGAAQGALEDLFAAADPRNNEGRSLTARELLDQGALRIGERFADQPELGADLDAILGRLYQRLGAFDSAERHFAHARGFAEDHPADRPRLIGALRDSANLRLSRGSPAEGLAWIDRALALDAAEPATAQRDDLLEAKANLLRRLGRYGEAMPLQQDLLTAAERVHGGDSLEAAEAAIQLGFLYQHTGRNDDSIALLRRALSIRSQRLGEEHLDTARARSSLAEWLQASGHLEESEALQRQALATMRRVLPARHYEIAGSLNSLGLILVRQGRHDEAAPYLDEAVQITGDPATGSEEMHGHVLNNLALNAYSQGDMAAAAAWYGKARDQFLRLYGAEHADTLQAEMALGAVELGRGNFDTAASTLRRVLDGRERLYGTGDAVYVNSLNLLARALTGTGDAEAALPLLARAVAIEEGGMNAYDLDAITRIELSHSRLMLGDVEGARREARLALELLAPRYPEGGLTVARAQVALASAELEGDDAGAARTLARAAFAQRRETLGADNPQAVEAEVLLRLAECRLDPAAAAASTAAIARLAKLQPWHMRLAAWRTTGCGGVRPDH